VFDWNDLRYFLAVARAGSTLAAARTLGTSQSTVHRRLAELEVQIGRPLVKRHPTGYRLTEIGERLLPFAQNAEEAIAAFERQALAFDEDLTGTIRVTCTPTVAERLSKSALLDAFHARYPGLRVEFAITFRLQDLSKGEADIAIRFGEPRDGALVARKIMDVPRAVYASRAYVERHGRPQSGQDFANHFVVAFDGEGASSGLARWMRSLAPRATVAARSDSWPSLIQAVRSGIGLAALPTWIGDCDADLVRVVDPAPELNNQLWLCIHADMRRMPRVRAFFDYLVAEMKAFRGVLSQGDGQGTVRK
jgi:DNA-binding transcriptional LysR family regulator